MNSINNRNNNNNVYQYHSGSNISHTNNSNNNSYYLRQQQYSGLLPTSSTTLSTNQITSTNSIPQSQQQTTTVSSSSSSPVSISSSSIVSSTNSNTNTGNWFNITKSHCFLGGIIICQWLLFTIIINQRYDREAMVVKRLIALESKLKQQQRYQQQQQQQQQEQKNLLGIPDVNNQQRVTIEGSSKLEGVFVTLLFKAPRWFHLRYKVMIDNAIMNLPNKNWRVQIFVNEAFATSELYQWHPGLKRIIVDATTATSITSNSSPPYDSTSYYDNNIIVTMLPTNFTSNSKQKIRPKDITSSEWFWNTIQSDHVVMFSGNGAFCGNHDRRNVQQFWNTLIETVDYCGVPYSHTSRSLSVGGDGTSHSYRNRQAMLRLLRYYNDKNNTITNSKTFDDNDTVDAMVRINKEIIKHNRTSNTFNSNNETGLFRLATPEQQHLFGGVSNLSSSSSSDLNTLQHLPYVVAGTQAHLSYNERDSLLKHCPEIKVIFPSMHEPTCFGAHPNPNTCKESICALQERIPSSGC